MTFFNEGGSPAGRGIPATKCYRATFGVRLGNGQVTPCTVQGQKAEFIFGDTVDGVDTVPNGFGVPFFSTQHVSGADGIPLLAGGPVTAGHGIVVGMANFVNDDGATVSLPVGIDVDDADDGDWIVGRATYASDAAAADTDIHTPSLAIETYAIPMQVRGAETASNIDTFTFGIELPLLADGDVITDWTPGFAGTIVSVAFRVIEPVTTAAKAATLNLEIDGVDVTGGVLALTSANMTPASAVVNGTAITALNTFAADSTITVEASAVTTFIEGSGEIIITVRHAAA